MIIIIIIIIIRAAGYSLQSEAAVDRLNSLGAVLAEVQVIKLKYI